ncbi:MAG: MerR family transcriptional regulator [Paracoccus denitrificans]|nr:MAG: MerR family transcriptional regulator [Paracoccus denitrificans]PZO83747.1 MAG: MerR family transcriptional regulator [Paracoccus denitrificans]
MTAEGDISFKDMCARFDVTPRTLRYYEYIELLSPRREGRARFYGPREVARMKLIMRGRRWGFGLEQIRQWLGLYEQTGTREQYRVFVGYADQQLQELEKQIAELKIAQDDLKSIRDETEAQIAAMKG